MIIEKLHENRWNLKKNQRNEFSIERSEIWKNKKSHICQLSYPSIKLHSHCQFLIPAVPQSSPGRYRDASQSSQAI